MTHSRLLELSQENLASKLLENARGQTPLCIEQIDILLRLVSAAAEPLDSFLCIGAELAMVASAISDEHPGAQAMLLATSTEESEKAHLQFRAHGTPSRVRVILLPGGCPSASLGETSYSAVICAAAGTRLGLARRDLFIDCHRLLKPGGVLINVGAVASAARLRQPGLEDHLIQTIFGEDLRHASDKSPAEIARNHFRRTAGAVPDAAIPLEVQCDWLREIGFENVDCYSKVAELAIFGGQRAV